jgi:hypothetical protein
MSSIVTTRARRRVTAGIAIAALGVGAPAAAASTDAGGEVAHQAAGNGVDLRSPDAQAAESEAAAPVVDLRSADARAAATPVVDLRSPDAKASEGTAVAATEAPAPVVTDTGTSEWVYVGIIGAGLLLLGGAAASTVRYRHHHPHGGNLAH